LQVEDMRAAAEGVDAGPRAGIRPLESPAAGGTESFGTAPDEDDHLLRMLRGLQ
jgi:hypothetical protein